MPGWIHSMAATEILTITCHSIAPVQINLDGAGVLKLAPECVIKTKDTIIPATTPQAGESELISKPGFYLNLTKISPTVSNYAHLLSTPIFETNNVTATESGIPSFDANSKTLDELEQRLMEFAVQRRLKGKHLILIYGLYEGLVLICLIFILYLCRKPLNLLIRALCGIWRKPRTNSLDASSNNRRLPSSNNVEVDFQLYEPVYQNETNK